MPLEEWRDLIERWEVVTAEPGGVDYLETDAGGVPAMWAVPKRSAADRVLLCLHGGGFVVGSMYTHRKLFGHIAKAAGVRALIPDFRRPPEHVHPAPLQDVVAAYSWLLDQGIDASHVAFTGDSAGGGLAITAMLGAREHGLPLPTAAMPFSPWVDMECSGEWLVSNQGKDALFAAKEAIQALAGIFLGEGGSPQDPLASPLYADLAGLPPVYIQVSGDELLLDDSRRLAEHARKAGVDVRLDIFGGEGLQHTFQFSAGRAPEADEAIRRLAASTSSPPRWRRLTGTTRPSSAAMPRPRSPSSSSRTATPGHVRPRSSGADVAGAPVARRAPVHDPPRLRGPGNPALPRG